MQPFLQSEAELRVAQAEYDKQVEITRLLLEGFERHPNQPPATPGGFCREAGTILR